MTTERLVETASGWEISFTDATVTRCSVDEDSFGLLIDEGSGEIAEATFVAPAELREGEKTTVIGAVNTPEAYAPALALVTRGVAGVTFTRDGRFEVRFTNDDVLTVSPDSDYDYEAWEFSFGKIYIVCTVGGGEPVIFDGAPENTVTLDADQAMEHLDRLFTEHGFDSPPRTDL